MRQPNAPIMVNVSLAADAASDAVLLKQEFMCSIQAVWTGTAVGNFTIETSDDMGSIDDVTGRPTGITHWTTYTGSTQAAGGSSGSFVWRLNFIPDAWVRLKYTSSSSTGTVNARFNAKG